MATRVEKVLVVDEDPEVLELVAQQLLASQGYPVHTAQDGNTALKLALEVKPEIILTSMELPGLSGRDLLAALRAEGLDSLVIATGPKGAEKLALQAFRLGAKDFLFKPLREAEVIAALDHVLEDLRLRLERGQLAQRLSAANQQLEKRLKELNTLYGVGKAVTALTNLGQLFARLLEGALFVTEGELAWVVLADEGSGKLVLRAAKNLPTLGGAQINQPWDDGLSSMLMLSGEGITLGGKPLAKMRAGQVAKAVVAVPIKVKDQVLGVIAVGNKTGRPFTERDQAMLSAVADYASIALVNARLFHTLEARVHALQKQREEIGHHLRAPLAQARATLDQILHGKSGALAQPLADAVRAAQEQLEAVQKVVDALAPPDAAGRPPHT
jgi:two-component system NtrC family sensor kinase